MKSDVFNGFLKTIKTNRTSFASLYEYYFPKIVLYVRSKYGNKICAEDIAQDFFLFILNKTFDEEIRYPNSWVIGVADNMAYRVYKKNYGNEEIPESIPDKPFDDDYIAINDAEELLMFVDNDTAEIIKKKLFYGYSLKEIAIAMGKNQSTVRNIYSRGLKKLKKVLKERDKNDK